MAAARAQPPRRTVVSITPLPLEADSRTWKQACTFAREGWRSIVVEGRGSVSAPVGAGVELISLRAASSGAAQPPSRRLRRSLLAAMQGSRWGAVADPALFLYAVLRYHREQNGRMLARLPPADLYVLHSFYHYPLVRRACARDAASFIYDAHDFYMATSADARLANRLMRRFYAAVERRCVRRAGEILTVSTGVAGLIEQTFGRRPRVVRNVHDPRLDQPAPETVRQAAGVQDGDLLAVCVGNYKTGMALDPLLAALERLPESVHVAFLGRGYEAVAARIAAAPCGRRVHLLAPVPPSQVVPFIASADLGLVLYFAETPNYEHALPNGFFQSIAAGLPVLYPPLSEIRAIAGQHGFGVPFDSRSTESLVDAFGALAADPERRAALRDRARTAATVLSWETEERRLLDAVEAVMRQEASRAAAASAPLRGRPR